MKISKIHLCVLLPLLCTLGSLQAQNKEILEKFAVLKGDVIRIEDKIRSSKISGSPFFEKDFEKGFLHFPGHSPFPAEMRYDIVAEKIHVLVDDESYKILEDDDVVVTINGHTFRKFNYRNQDTGGRVSGYFEVLNPDKDLQDILLLDKHYKEVKTGTRAQARGFAPEFRDRSDHYIKLPDNEPVLIDRKKEKFLAKLPADVRQEIGRFIEDENLKLRKEDDLIELVRFYNDRFFNKNE